MMHAGLLPLACLLAVAAGFAPANPRAGGRLVGSRSAVPCDPAVDECPADSVSEHVDVPKSQSIRWRPSLEDSKWWLMRTESSTRQHAELSRLRLAGALALPSTDEVALDSRLEITRNWLELAMIGETREWLIDLAPPQRELGEAARAWLEHSCALTRRSRARDSRECGAGVSPRIGSSRAS